jgi:hypothetical protein
MRQASKIDANQPDIVAALRAIGASVQSLSATGKGVPDLLVGWHGRTYLLEVKDGTLPPSARRLTPDQEAWHKAWCGRPVTVITCVEEAISTLQELNHPCCK